MKQNQIFMSPKGFQSWNLSLRCLNHYFYKGPYNNYVDKMRREGVKTLFFQNFVDNTQQRFAFKSQANFPAHNLNFH